MLSRLNLLFHNQPICLLTRRGEIFFVYEQVPSRKDQWCNVISHTNIWLGLFAGLVFSRWHLSLNSRFRTRTVAFKNKNWMYSGSIGEQISATVVVMDRTACVCQNYPIKKRFTHKNAKVGQPPTGHPFTDECMCSV